MKKGERSRRRRRKISRSRTGIAVQMEEEKSAAEEFVYRICPEQEWRSAQAAGALQGGELDSSSGYIHLSTSSQVEGTLSRFYAGRDDLYLLKIDAAKLGDGLRYDEVEGVGTFPHFYGPHGAFSPLPVIAVESSFKLTLENNKHVVLQL